MLDSVLDIGDIINKANKISYGVNISLGYRCVLSCFIVSNSLPPNGL